MQNEIIKYEGEKRQWNHEEIEYYLMEYGKSNGSRADFARANKIPATTFYGWIKRSKKRHTPLAEVKMDTPLPKQKILNLKFPNRIELSMNIESAAEFKGILRSILTC